MTDQRITVLKVNTPANADVKRPSADDIDLAVRHCYSFPQEDRMIEVQKKANDLVIEKNAQLTVWADISAPAHVQGVEHTDQLIEHAKFEIIDTNQSVQTYDRRMARNTQRFDGKDVEYSTSRVESERRSRAWIAVVVPLALGAETYFAATNLQSSGIYEHFDYVPGANLLPLIFAALAVILVYIIAQGKISHYRHFDHDKTRETYREKLNKARALWTPIWIILAAIIFSSAIMFGDIGTRSSYPDIVNAWVKFWNLSGVVLQGPILFLMIIFLAVQIWGISTVAASIFVNEEHAYLKAREQSTRKNEAHFARQAIHQEQAEIRQDRADNAATCEAVRVQIQHLKGIIESEINAKIQMIEFELKSAHALAELKALQGKTRVATLAVANS